MPSNVFLTHWRRLWKKLSACERRLIIASLIGELCSVRPEVVYECRYSTLERIWKRLQDGSLDRDTAFVLIMEEVQCQA